MKQLQLLLTPDVPARRVERSHKFLTRLERQNKGKIRVFRIKKVITRNAAINRRNARYLTDVPVANVDGQMHVNMRAEVPEKIKVIAFFDPKNRNVHQFSLPQAKTASQRLPKAPACAIGPVAHRNVTKGRLCVLCARAHSPHH